MLIVDDSVTQCQVLQEQLSSWGIEAECAVSARAGLAMLQEGADAGKPFEAAIVDINMPEMGGLEAWQRRSAFPGHWNCAICR